MLTCRDFITSFQKTLNMQMKILLKLLFRFEKQISEEKLVAMDVKNSTDISTLMQNQSPFYEDTLPNSAGK